LCEWRSRRLEFKSGRVQAFKSRAEDMTNRGELFRSRKKKPQVQKADLGYMVTAVTGAKRRGSGVLEFGEP
jgi:hypothetical protein